MFLHYIPVSEVETWLIVMDCRLYSAEEVNYCGTSMPVDEVALMVTLDHGVDSTLHRLCGVEGRNYEPGGA